MFDNFQCNSPTFSFVAVLLNCSFFSKFEVVLGVLYKLEKKCFETKLFCFLVMKTLSKLFSMGFNSF